MQPRDRNTWRIAQCVHHNLYQAQFTHETSIDQTTVSLFDAIERFIQNARKTTKATTRGWHHAARRLRRQTQFILRDLESQIRNTHSRMREDQLPPLVTLREISQDLQGIRQEFGDFQYDPRNKLFTVRTPAVELEQLYLGPFDIEVSLNQLAESRHIRPYHVNAVDPNTPAGSSNVTHPHVCDDHLCEGTAAASISAALLSGRLYDFFQIIYRVLQTYNPESPYVRIEDWDGQQCEECGCRIGDEDRYYCDVCQYDYCPDCIRMCHYCEESVCVSCSTVCNECDETICKECMTECEECHEPICKDCLEDGLCPTCLEERNSNDEESEETNNTPSESQATGPSTTSEGQTINHEHIITIQTSTAVV